MLFCFSILITSLSVCSNLISIRIVKFHWTTNFHKIPNNRPEVNGDKGILNGVIEGLGTIEWWCDCITDPSCSVLVLIVNAWAQWRICMRRQSGSWLIFHYNDVIMSAIAFQITSLTIVYLTVHSDTDQRKHQSSASLAFVRGIHRRPVNSPHKWPVTREMSPFDDVIMENGLSPISLCSLYPRTPHVHQSFHSWSYWENIQNSSALIICIYFMLCWMDKPNHFPFADKIYHSDPDNNTLEWIHFSCIYVYINSYPPIAACMR